MSLTKQETIVVDNQIKAYKNMIAHLRAQIKRPQEQKASK
jgi:hypothetical protein